MSQAVIHGKISRSGSNLTSASEDLLTGSVFGMFRYLPANQFLKPLLHLSKSISEPGRFLLTKPKSQIITVNFWPKYEFSEPDVEIQFEGHHIFIEAKYLSGKSGSGDVNDQLKREFQDLVTFKNLKGVNISLIYLTKHRLLPEESIKQSINAVRADDKIKTDQFLENTYWLSWLDIWEFVVQKNECEDHQKVIVADICQYLEKLGLKHFTGFKTREDVSVPNVKKPIFYQR